MLSHNIQNTNHSQLEPIGANTSYPSKPELTRASQLEPDNPSQLTRASQPEPASQPESAIYCIYRKYSKYSSVVYSVYIVFNNPFNPFGA